MAPPDRFSRSRASSTPGTGLRGLLRAIDGAPFQAYRRIVGDHDLGEFRLKVLQVPSDALAGPARVRLSIDRQGAGLDGAWSHGDLARVVIEDAIVRAAARALEELIGPAASSAPGSGRVWIDPPGPCLAERTAACVGDDTVDVGLAFDLPAAARRVRGQQAEAIVFEHLPRVAMAALLFPLRRVNDLKPKIASLARRRAVARALKERGLAVLVPAGGLPGRSMPTAGKLTVETPHGPASGWAVPTGITLFVSAGVSGTGAWLRDLVAGADPAGGPAAIFGGPVAWVRAGRHAVGPLDLRPFVRACSEVPNPGAYESSEPPAPLAVAASLVEAVEAGARILVLDEDEIPAGAFGGVSALPGLVGPSENLVSLTERFADLRDRWGVSFLVAARPSSPLSVVADTVLVLRADGALDVSEAVRATARTAGRRLLGTSGTVAPPSQRSVRISVDEPASGLKVAAWGARGARVGDDLVDLSDTTVAGDPARLRAIAALLKRAAALAPAWRPVEEVLDALEEACVRTALDEAEEPGLVDLTRPSRVEIAAALVRWKHASFRVSAGTLRPNVEDPS